MSRIHQAIRKAEQEGKAEHPLEEKKSNPRILEIKQQLAHEHTVKVAEEPGVEDVSITEKGDLAITKESYFEISHDSKLVPLYQSKAIASEQYRNLKAKLYQMRETQQLKSLLVTSVASGDGKTLTSVNLALTIAQEIDQKVLLVDADLRKPSVGDLLGLKFPKGLADLLLGEINPTEIIYKSKVDNLLVVPGGQVPENPAELLNTQKMRDFVAMMEEQYDWVIFDSPPFGTLADAELISALVDGLLLVVRASKTATNLIAKSLVNLKAKNLLGVIFNSVPKLDESHYYHYYGRPRK
jgi:capsular exopolysaccharide synthesis family protein